MPRRPGPLVVPDDVKRHLLVLRMITEYGSERPLPQPRADVSQVDSLEEALRTRVPDPIIAACVNFDDVLHEHDFDLTQLWDLNRAAKRRKLPKDMLAVGSLGDGHGFYCIPRNDSSGGTLYEFDNQDQNLSGHSFAEWLADWVESRRDFLAGANPAVRDLMPTGEELAGFIPSLD